MPNHCNEVVTTVVKRRTSEKRWADNKFKYGAVSPLAHTPMRNSQIFNIFYGQGWVGAAFGTQMSKVRFLGRRPLLMVP